MVEASEAIGYVIAEGEMTYALTDSGTELPSTMKIRPQESFFDKLIKRFKLDISFDITKLFKQ